MIVVVVIVTMRWCAICILDGMCNCVAVRGLEDSLGSPNAAPRESDENDEE